MFRVVSGQGSSVSERTTLTHAGLPAILSIPSGFPPPLVRCDGLALPLNTGAPPASRTGRKGGLTKERRRAAGWRHLTRRDVSSTTLGKSGNQSPRGAVSGKGSRSDSAHRSHARRDVLK